MTITRNAFLASTLLAPLLALFPALRRKRPPYIIRYVDYDVRFPWPLSKYPSLSESGEPIVYVPCDMPAENRPPPFIRTPLMDLLEKVADGEGAGGTFKFEQRSQDGGKA